MVKLAWNGAKQKRVVERIGENKGGNGADFLKSAIFERRGSESVEKRVVK